MITMQLMDFIDACNIRSKNETEVFALLCYYAMKENGMIAFSVKKMMYMYGEAGLAEPDTATLKKDAAKCGTFRPFGIEGTLKFNKEAIRAFERTYGHLWDNSARPKTKDTPAGIYKVRLGIFTDACEMPSKDRTEGLELLCYYVAKEKDGRSFSVREVLDLYEEAGLGAPDRSSLEKQMRKHASFRRVGIDGSLEFHSGAFAAIDVLYGKIWNNANETPKSSAPSCSEVIDEKRFCGVREGLDKLIIQVNSSYRDGSYDSCALVMRRLLEAVLIYSFQTAGLEKEISDNGRYQCFDDIVKKAVSNKALSVSQAADDLLKASSIGDYSKQGPMYTFSANDINSVRTAYRNVLDTLFSALKTM